MPYEFFISLRYTLVGRHDRFVSFVSLLSVLGIALGVASLLVVLAVMTGFQNELRAKILSIASHLEAVAHRGETIEDWRQVADSYLGHPQVLAAAPNIQEQGLLVGDGEVRGALVRGVLPAHEKKASRLESFVVAGRLDDLQADGYGILPGRQLADKLGLAVGDKVMLVSPRGRLTAAGLLPRLRRFTVVGIFASDVFQYDSTLAYIHLADAQKVFRLPGPTSVRFHLGDLLNVRQIKRELDGARDDVFLHDWTNSHGSLFRALALEKRVMFIILTLIVAVAAFNIVSALVTMVRNKRGDIAILRAMGVPARGITVIFLLKGALIGGAGTTLGLLCGLPLAVNAGAIVAWAEDQLDSRLFPFDVYQLNGLPSQVVASDVVTVAAMAFVLSLLAAVYPAWRSGRLPPAESLRYE